MVGNGWPQRREGFGGRRTDTGRPRRGATGNLQGEFLVHRWVELAKEGDDYDEGDPYNEYGALGPGNEPWDYGLHEARESFVPEYAIHNDLQR